MLKRGLQKASSHVGFFQEPPVLPSKFDSDLVLQGILKRYLPEKHFASIKDELSSFGQAAVKELKELGDNAEANHPKLEQYDAWGHRIDRLITSEGWRKLQEVSAKEGLVSIAYERKLGEFSRIYQFAKLYLFAGTTAVYGCPLSMTDGATRLIELYGDAKLKSEVLPRLISRDPKVMWTSGQWMTERPGGSDVGNTETIAEMGPDGQWKISGFKWFSSATEADMTMLLARVIDKDGKYVEGSKGLSLFFARVRDDNGKLNGVRVQRLKNKFGTKALPTAELELDGMQAQMVGEQGRGVATIATILNITRIHQAVHSTAFMRTALQFAQDFALKRKAFGKPLHQHPLHIQTLAWMEVETRVATELTFHVVYLLGKSECGVASKVENSLLRLLTPLVKMFVAKQGTRVTSEAMEALGGQGYIEDSGLPRLYRDAQVGSIWEGTTNVLSLDVLRVLKSSPGSLQDFEDAVNSKLKKAKGITGIQQGISQMENALTTISNYVKESLPKELIEAGARDLCNTMSRVYGGSLLIDSILQNEGSNADGVLAFNAWCQNGLVSYSTVFPKLANIGADAYRLAMNRSML